jgi:hypothetical protein
MPRSSSGLGCHPFKVEITGSNPVRGTFFLSEEKPGILSICLCQAFLYLPLILNQEIHSIALQDLSKGDYSC